MVAVTIRRIQGSVPCVPCWNEEKHVIIEKHLVMITPQMNCAKHEKV